MERRTAQRIAVVDDEEDILALVRLNLEEEGFAVDCHPDGESLMASLQRSAPDLIVLDLMLPGRDGRDICRQLRAGPRTSTIPVIMLTALDGVPERVAGLELGADDYITKPFSPREMVARVRAVLRRMKHSGSDPVIRFGDLLEIDSDRFEVRVEGSPVPLTSTEFRLLRILAEGSGRVFARDRLLDGLWEGEKLVFDRTIDVHIRNLRMKLGAAAHLVRSVRGAGYKLQWP